MGGKAVVARAAVLPLSLHPKGRQENNQLHISFANSQGSGEVQTNTRSRN